MEDLSNTTQLILQLLSNNSPELGARLKQRLNKLLLHKGLSPFDEKGYGYKRFSDFLQSALGEKVAIERPQGAGDIHVSLRQPQITQHFHVAYVANAKESKEQSLVIRSDVWQAFINPDPERKRFLHKATLEIRHFLQNEPNPIKEEVAQDSSNFIEINQISGEIQVKWMRAFLDSTRMSSSERAPLEAIIAEPYSSAVNTTYTRALGALGSSWRQFRTNRVIDTIKKWASEHDVPFHSLCIQKSSENLSSMQSRSDQSQLTARQQATKLLELLSEEDIARLVIPTLLSTIMVKSRL